jgi:SanA protein
MHKKTKIRNILLIFLLIIIAFIWFANWKIESDAKHRLYDRTSELPYRKVGLLLGTSKMLRHNIPNPYFIYRIEAAVDLFNSGKIDCLVVSGDNSRSYYNEPEDMRQALLKRGIPSNKIHLDYAGFRTLDSVVRMHKIFGQSSFTVISQQFHNQRAIFIGQSKGLDVVGYNAKDVDGQSGLKTNVREIFARVKVFLDLLVGKNPKFLGEPVEI